MDGEGREGLTGFATGHSDRTHIAAFGRRLTVRNHKNTILLVGTCSGQNIAVSVLDMSYSMCICTIGHSELNITLEKLTKMTSPILLKK